jgi:hypothetical protein
VFNCELCLDQGIAPVNEMRKALGLTADTREDYAVCRCAVGQRQRYAQQIGVRRKTSRVAPFWLVWSAEWNVPARADVQSGLCPDEGRCIDLVEKWFSPADMARLFPQRRIA